MILIDYGVLAFIGFYGYYTWYWINKKYKIISTSLYPFHILSTNLLCFREKHRFLPKIILIAFSFIKLSNWKTAARIHSNAHYAFYSWFAHSRGKKPKLYIRVILYHIVHETRLSLQSWIFCGDINLLKSSMAVSITLISKVFIPKSALLIGSIDYYYHLKLKLLRDARI